MSRDTTRDDDTDLPEFRELLRTSSNATLPCAGSTEWFSDNPKEQRRAAALCSACSWLTACRNYATAANTTHGVWGGTTPADRKRERRQRRAA